MVDDCVCVVRLDMTTPPWWREKVKVYIIVNVFHRQCHLIAFSNGNYIIFEGQHFLPSLKVFT